MIPQEEKKLRLELANVKKLLKLHETKDHISKPLPQVEFIYNENLERNFGNGSMGINRRTLGGFTGDI